MSAGDPCGRTLWIADAHRGDGKRFVVSADDKLTAFVGLESAILGTLSRKGSRTKGQHDIPAEASFTERRIHCYEHKTETLDPMGRSLVHGIYPNNRIVFRSANHRHAGLP